MMRPEFDVIAPLAETAAGRLDPLHVETPNYRALWKHYVVDLVLPVGTLVSMAVLTVVVIVLVVTTVAEARLDLEAGRNEAWSRWACSPACTVWNHRSAYAGLASSMDTMQANRDAPRRSVPDEITSLQIALRLDDE